MSAAGLQSDTPMEFPLLKNGLDYILASVEGLQNEPDAREIKYAIVHLWTGVELVLKERLSREHWALIFDRLDQASRKRLESGDFISVGFEPLVNRLADICNVAISQDNMGILDTLRKHRNRLEHFGIVASSNAAKAEVFKASNFILDFINHQFEPSSVGIEEEMLIASIRTGLGSITEFIEHRWEMISNEAGGDMYSPAARCVTCGERALTYLGVGELRCLFCGDEESYPPFSPSCSECRGELTLGDGDPRCDTCGWSEDPAGAARSHIFAELGLHPYIMAKEGIPEPVWECPSCEYQALVPTGTGGNQYREVEYLCFSCGQSWVEGMIAICGNCHNAFPYTLRDGDQCPVCMF